MTMTRGLHASYSAFSRWTHWLTLILIIGLFALAWSVDDLPEALRDPATQLHQSLGITVLGLTILRLVWRFAAGVPALPDELPAVQKLAALYHHFVRRDRILAGMLQG